MSPKKFVIDRPYYSQLNNDFNPKGACFNTSVACLLSPFVAPGKYKGKQLEDYIWDECNNGIGKEYAKTLSYYSYLNGNNSDKLNYFDRKVLNIVWDIEKYVANNIQDKVIVDWVQDGTEAEILFKFLENSPVLVQIWNSAGGHVITVLGFDGNDYIIHDSYGNWIDSYNNRNGKYVRYSTEKLIPELVGNPIRMMFIKEFKAE